MAVKTIGSGGDYSTVQAWEDSILATLLGNEEGQCLNQEFSDSGTIVDFSAHDTTLGTLTLTAAAGASFKDNANVRTNALRYNASNGAGLKTTGGYTPVVVMSGNVPRLIIKRLQFYCTRPGNSLSGFGLIFGGASGSLTQDCIVEKAGGAGSYAAFISSEKVVNCAFIDRVVGGGNVVGTNNSGQGTGTVSFINCIAVCASNVAPGVIGYLRSYVNIVLTNCASFGYTSPTSGGGSFSGSNNATDASSGLPGSSNQHSVTYSATTPFIQADATGSLDFRLANDANALINNGALDATNAPNDISGTARNSPCEIGVWELVSAGAAAFYNYEMTVPAQVYRRTQVVIV